MDFENFIQQLAHYLTQPLPGEAAQFKMAPARRLTFKEYYEEGKINPKQSAVLICLYPYQDFVYTVLTLRPSEFGIHSDQVSFPGGRFEEADESLQATALRETYEEIGIESSELNVIGKLTPIYIPVSNYLVHPFIAVSYSRPEFSLNQNEVKQIMEIEISIFIKEEIKGFGIFISGRKEKIDAPFYEVQQQKIWGATAMILSEFEFIIQPLLTSS
ncbi:MAG TPA: CoA pyrophosphatase [Chitinophagales bacterium]|nr:CoA pyrophosphatase [Chitinophagales bacterium]